MDLSLTRVRTSEPRRGRRDGQLNLTIFPRGDILVSVTIYHNPKCETSRNTLALIRNAGIEPTIIEYLQRPPSRVQLLEMIKAAGLSIRGALREKGTPFAELGLGDPKLSDDQLLDVMLVHPILINRPFVVTERGTRLSRPSEIVLDILSLPQRGYFTKEDGEVVINEKGERVGPKQAPKGG
jgi:arsenate reductase